MSPLLPERPLLISPSLAATIGLEEAALLSTLDELSTHLQGDRQESYIWYTIGESELNKRAPFWDQLDIQRIAQQLRNLGILLLASAPYSQSQELRFAFNHHQQPAAKPLLKATAQRTVSKKANLIAANWQPDSDTLKMLGQLNIPEHFIREQVGEFVHYWRERGETHRTWGSKFVQHVKRLWTHHVVKNNNAETLPAHWQPSEELTQHIAKEGIPSTFVQKSLQRFSLYHKNHGTKQIQWDMSFFSWLKEDWEKNDTPYIDRQKSELSPDWQPDKHTIDYLTRSHGIDQGFIQDCIPEFVHKWIDKKAIHSDWGNLFAKHITEQWSFVQQGAHSNPIPRIINAQWQPSADCVEMLENLSGINRQFIYQQIPEFILYWKNRGEAKHSWDNNFLRHVKYNWKLHNERQQDDNKPRSTRDISLEERLTDRSWAQ